MFNTVIFLSLMLTVNGYSSLCVKNNKSCSPQLWEDSYDDNRCQMIYYGLNSTVCYKKEYKLSSSMTDFGSVQLQPYMDKNPIIRTAFNVTFRNIKWKYLKMRFKQSQIAPTCMCRDFYIANEEIVASDKVMYYDCPWSDASFEGKEVVFAFEYGNDKHVVGKKYTFFVPKHEELDVLNPKVNLTNLTLFLYVEQTDSRNLILKIQVPPDKFQVERLIVDVFRARNNLTNKEDIRIVPTAQARFGEIEFIYNTFGEHGAYSFAVRFDHPSCEIETCMVSRTPVIVIPNTFPVLTIGIVGIAGLIPLILIVLYIWRRQCLKLDMMHGYSKSVLLVPFPLNDSHANVASTLAQLLKHSLKLNVMLDIIDVPKTKSKDPFQWFSTTFRDATHVVFLLSQRQLASTKIVYKDIQNLALRLMQEELSNNSSRKQFSLITFPYSSKVPPELSNLKRFKFMAEFNDFLNYLRMRQFWLRLEETIDILGDKMHDELRDAIKLVEKNIEFDEEIIQWNSYDIVENKQKNCVLSPIHEFKIKPRKVDKSEYIYDVNELDLMGNKEEQKENLRKDLKQTSFDVNDLDL